MSEFDDKRPQDGPPPLVPPPVRSTDGADNTADGSADTTANAPAADDAPLFVEPGENPAPVDTAVHDTTARDDSAAHDSAAHDSAADHSAAHSSADDHAANEPIASYTAANRAAEHDAAEHDATENNAAQNHTGANDTKAYDGAQGTPAASTTAPPVAVPVAASAPAPIARDQQPDYSAQPTATPTAAAPAQPVAQQQTTQYAQQPPQQRSFTPPPVEPKKKGNRVVGSLIAVLSVVIFAALYVAVTMLIVAVTAPQQSVTEALTLFLVEPLFYVPVLFFVLGFVIVVLLVNRASWWAFVLGSLFVGALVYFGTIGVQLLLDNVLEDTPAQASARFVGYAVNPYVIAAGLVAREVSMWIGAAISSRGRRIKAKNIEARDEYERAAAQHRAEYERGYATA